MKAVLRVVVSLALSALFLWFAFREVDLVSMWGRLQTVDSYYVALYTASLVVIQACRVFRWGVLIRPFAQIPTSALIRISCLGLMLILALPLRLGEFARPYLLKRESGAPMSAGLGSVTVERTIDGLLVTLLFFVMTLNLDAAYAVPPALTAAAYASLAIFGTATAVIIAALWTGELVPRLLRRYGNRISEKLTEKLVSMLEAFISGLRSFPDYRAVLKCTAYTLAYWAGNGLGCYAVMVGFGWDLPPIAGFVLVCIIVLGIMIPAGPGNLGTFQTAILLGLSVFGVNATDAAAYGLVVYPLTVIVVVGLGLPFLFSRKIQLGSIVRASSEA